jgi:hypothetical protein
VTPNIHGQTGLGLGIIIKNNNLKRNNMELFASIIIAIPLWLIVSELRILNRKG